MCRRIVLLLLWACSVILLVLGYIAGRLDQRATKGWPGAEHLATAGQQPTWPKRENIIGIKVVTFTYSQRGPGLEMKRPVVEEGLGAQERYGYRHEAFEFMIQCLLEAHSISTNICTYEPSGYIELQLEVGASKRINMHRGDYISCVQDGKLFSMIYDADTFGRRIRDFGKPTEPLIQD